MINYLLQQESLDEEELMNKFVLNEFTHTENESISESVTILKKAGVGYSIRTHDSKLSFDYPPYSKKR